MTETDKNNETKYYKLVDKNSSIIVEQGIYEAERFNYELGLNVFKCKSDTPALCLSDPYKNCFNNHCTYHYGDALCFTKFESLFDDIELNKYVYDVEFPEDTDVYYNNDFARSHKFILKNKRLIEDMEEFNDEQKCFILIKKNPKILKYIKKQTYELCLTAVKNNGSSLEYVKPELQTKKLCTIAVENYGYAIEYVNDEFLTKEICLKAVKAHGFSFRKLKDEFKTKDIYIEAIKSKYSLLKYISNKPDLIIDNNLLLESIRYNARTFEDIEHKYINKEFCDEAIKKNIDIVTYIYKYNNKLENDSKLYNDNEMYNLFLKLIEKDPSKIRYEIPKKFIDNKMIETSIRKEPLTIKYITMQTEDLCKLAVSKNAEAFKFVGKQTPQICKIALKQNGLLLEYISNYDQTEENCIDAINQNALALQYVSDKYYNKDLYIKAVRLNPNAIKYVKEIDKEVLEEAIKYFN